MRKASKIKLGHITLKASALNTSSLWTSPLPHLPASYTPKAPCINNHSLGKGSYKVNSHISLKLLGYVTNNNDSDYTNFNVCKFEIDDNYKQNLELKIRMPLLSSNLRRWAWTVLVIRLGPRSLLNSTHSGNIKPSSWDSGVCGIRGLAPGIRLSGLKSHPTHVNAVFSFPNCKIG